MLSTKAFATAGFAERYHDHQYWMFPAYAYCLGFGLVILSILNILSLIFKIKVDESIGWAYTFLKGHPIFGIIVGGILWAILLGLSGIVSFEIINLLAIIPFLVIFLFFPLVLVYRKIREKLILSPIILKWTVMIAISAIIASALFIILTNCGILKGTDITYWDRPNRIHRDYPLTHPYDSMMDIWGMPILFMAEILISIVLFYFGEFSRFILNKLSNYRKKRETQN